MKIAVFVEHDIVVRHFLHSGAFTELERAHDVIFVFPEVGHRRVKSNVDSLPLGGRVVRIAESYARLSIWKQLLLTDMLRWRPGAAFRALRRLRRMAVGTKAILLFGGLSLPGIFQVYRARAFRKLARMPNHDLEAFFDREKPDVVVHPSVLDGVFINDLVESCTRRSLPLVVLMNSWDNPSTKRAVLGVPDWLLVWGPQTKAHAIRFMGMKPERTIEFGAAQFDVYRTPPRMDRAEFCRRHGIEPAAKILLYAGSSKETDEYAHLIALDEAIERGQLGQTVVVYRPHPWGDGGKDGARVVDRAWRHVRIESTMRGYLEGVKAGNRAITLPDYRDTHDVLCAVDALVSPLSTIILEAALHGKPALCFLPDEDALHLRMSLPLIHFEEFFRSTVFHSARGIGALVDGVRHLLAEIDDPAAAARYREAAQFFARSFDRPYPERLREFIEGVARPAA